jgi:hypothetical protein
MLISPIYQFQMAKNPLRPVQNAKRSNASPYATIIRALDAEILRLKTSMVVLQRQRNALLPMLRLPVELLTKIFLDVVFDEAEDTALNWSSFSFSQTSHLLREISLKTPMLWSRPIILAPSLAEEMVRRSQRCLLSIIADVRAELSQRMSWYATSRRNDFGGMMTPTWARSGRPTTPHQVLTLSHNPRKHSFDEHELVQIEAVLARIMRNQGDRFRSLFLTTDCMTMGRLLRSFSSSAPALEVLVLRQNKRVDTGYIFSEDEDEDEDDEDDEDEDDEDEEDEDDEVKVTVKLKDKDKDFSKLPLAFLDALPVSLRFLRLHCTPFDWTAFSRFRLVTLIVESVTKRKTLSWDATFVALSQMRCLQTLILDRALPSDDAFQASVYTITLPALRRFNIRDGRLQCTKLLQSLSIPHATLVKVVIKDPSTAAGVTGAESLEDLCKALTFCMASLSQPLSILECEGEHLIRFSTSSGKDAGPVVNIVLRSRASTPLGQGVWFMLAGFARMKYLHNVQTLRLKPMYGRVNNSRLQMEVCQALTEVTELEVNALALHVLVAAGDASPLAVQLPLLRVLTFNKISEYSQEILGRRVNSACRALRARVVPVQCIHVVDDIKRQHSYLERLQAVADEVVWEMPVFAYYSPDADDEEVGEDDCEDIRDEYRYFGDDDEEVDDDYSIETYDSF